MRWFSVLTWSVIADLICSDCDCFLVGLLLVYFLHSCLFLVFLHADSKTASPYRNFGFPYSLFPRLPPLQSGAAFTTPAFSTPAVQCRVFHSRVFHPCSLVPRFPLPRFSPLHFCYSRVFHSRVFSRPFGRLNSWNSLRHFAHRSSSFLQQSKSAKFGRPYIFSIPVTFDASTEELIETVTLSPWETMNRWWRFVTRQLPLPSLLKRGSNISKFDL